MEMMSIATFAVFGQYFQLPKKSNDHKLEIFQIFNQIEDQLEKNHEPWAKFSISS